MSDKDKSTTGKPSAKVASGPELENGESDQEQNIGGDLIRFPSGVTCCENAGSSSRGARPENPSTPASYATDVHAHREGTERRKISTNEDAHRRQRSDSPVSARAGSDNNMQRLERDCAELQHKLREEVAKAVSKWKTRVGTTLENQNQTLECYIQKMDRKRVPAQNINIVSELKRENARLRQELDQLRRLNAKDAIIESKFQDLEEEIKTRRETVNKFQEQVNEKKATHAKDIAKKREGMTKSRIAVESSAITVQKLKEESDRLRFQMYRSRGEPEVSCQDTAPLTHLVCNPRDLPIKLEKAQVTLDRIKRELEVKRRHPKRGVTSAESLEELREIWTDHTHVLEKLMRRDREATVLRDRVDMYCRNNEILRDENADLAAKLNFARTEMARFRDNPMTPTALVEKNVSLLLHMENIEEMLAEKAVELEKQERDLKMEQHKVRDLLVQLEELRRENRHVHRRLQKNLKQGEREDIQEVLSTADDASDEEEFVPDPTGNWSELLMNTNVLGPDLGTDLGTCLTLDDGSSYESSSRGRNSADTQ